MSVEINPQNQLGFPRPLTQLVKRSISIHNPHSQPVAFKVKTTAPKQYCVRPNSGRVESGETVQVQVLLQALSVEPPPHAKCKDKFLVQSAFITPDEEMRTVAEMWLQTERTNKAAIHEQKIKCAYLQAEDGSTSANGIPEENEDAATGGDSRMVDDSQIFAAAPSSPTHVNGDKSQSPITPTNLPPTADRNVSSATPTKSEPIPSLSAADINSVGPSPTNVALEQSLAATTSDSEKLRVALAEVDSLRAQLAQAQSPQATGLRRRGGGVGPGAETAVEKAKEVVHGQQGVSLPVVAALVVTVFAVTYLFL